ncbi:MAG: MaoC/PaaZ C-terminal domain-containing protein [Syntrophales bacterium]
MELSSRHVGIPLKAYETAVTWRQTTNYAAALGDANPWYLDDSRPGGIVAPPMFSVAVTWPITERIAEFIESAKFPKEIVNTQVHYTEHLAIHRLVRPEDRLAVRGRIAAILPRKAGTLFVIRYDVTDAAGSPVFTEHIGGMMRGVRCIDEGRGGETLPVVPSFEASGAPIWEAPVFVDRAAPFIYDGCTDIYFPIHTSVAFARAVGLPDIIYQGTATLALAVRELTNREAEGDPRRVKAVSCRFTGMVIPGSEIRIRLIGKAAEGPDTHCFFEVLNAEGKHAIRDGAVILGPA